MDDRIGNYQRSRRKFVITVYLISALWLILAIAQWVAIEQIDDFKKIFHDSEWISVLTFLIAILFVMLFIFVEQIRFTVVINWLVTFVTIEFAIIGLFALVARSDLENMIMWFIICVLLLYVFVLIGTILPHDLTLDVVVIFVISFIFLISSIFLIMLFVLTQAVYTVIMYQATVTFIILIFVMYHAQTISGGRFAEMRLNDYLLATLILFFDFIIIFLLTFYVQTKYPFASKNKDKGSEETTTATTKAAGRSATRSFS